MPPRRRKPPRAGALTDLPPLKIIRSIVLLQLAYYLIALTLILFTTLVAGQRFSLRLIFDWRTVRGDNTVGWMLGVVWLLVSVFAAMILLLLISRSKLVPDFALTLHFLHLLTTALYTRQVPTNVLWWGLQIASVAIMASLGVWACRYRELRPISFGVGVGTAANIVGEGGGVGGNEAGKRGEGEESKMQEDDDDDDDDHVRGGRGRGKRRDDGGTSYEMVGIKEQSNAHAV